MTERRATMPKYMVTWTTNAVYIEAKDEDEAHEIAAALATEGHFATFMETTILEVNPDTQSFTLADANMGGEEDIG
jgi:hypothetical protein